MNLEWPLGEIWRCEPAELGGQPAVRFVYLGHRPWQPGSWRQKVDGTHVLRDFLKLEGAGCESVIEFHSRYGSPARSSRESGKCVPISEYHRKAAQWRSLVRIARELRKPAYDFQSVSRERVALHELAEEWNRGDLVTREPVRGSTRYRHERVDLKRFPKERYRLDGPESVVPDLTIGVLGPGPHDPHSYAVPIEIGMDEAALRAWIHGWRSYIPGWAQLRDSAELGRLYDGWLVEGIVNEILPTIQQSNRLTWDHEARRLEWATTITGVDEGLLHAVVREVTGGDLVECRGCGTLFPKVPAAGQLGGRPRSECPACYDPETPRRRAANRASARRRIAR